MDQRTRKEITMHQALNTRNGIDRLYVSRKEGGSRIASVEDSLWESNWRFEDNNSKKKEQRKSYQNDINKIIHRKTITK